MDAKIATYEVGYNENQTVQRVANTPHVEQEQAAREQFNVLLESASQPRHASGNACVKLCYYVEQCKKSASTALRELAFSQETCFKLFDFYIEWNEKNQHRSMRQVIELLASLITLNGDMLSSSIIKNVILQKILSIITHQSAQPFVKPALKILEFFLGKSTVSLKELAVVYGAKCFDASRNKFEGDIETAEDIESWHSFVSAVFEWMPLPDTAPAAGKLLVTLLQKFRSVSVGYGSYNGVSYITLWQKWVRNGLTSHPDSLDNIKNYLFPPLFKLDTIGSLAFLKDLVRKSSIRDLENQESNTQAFLLLSALEVGKKSGLVDDANSFLSNSFNNEKSRKSIILPEYSIGTLLGHRAGNVRSAAFSVLVSSISSIKPLTPETFNFLRQYLGLLHSDTDAKVRNEVLSNSKHMVGRIKGAISFLTREATSGYIRQNRVPQKNRGNHPVDELSVQESILLQEHKDFMSWYQSFLMNELIPTASYQRHITALRAIHIVVDSGISSPPYETNLKYLAGAESRRQPEEKLFTEKMMRLLLDLLMDPFEDVRAAANQLLKLAPETCYIKRGFAETSSPYPEVISTIVQNTSNKGSDITTSIETVDKTRLKQSGQDAVQEVLGIFIARAESASRRTGRADLADGVARTHELLFYFQATNEARLELVKTLVTNLECKVDIAEHDLAQAVHEASVHGSFAALRLVWELSGQPFKTSKHPTSHASASTELSWTMSNDITSWIGLQHRMIKCCFRIWLAVKEVLCNDSPEGHVLQDLEDVDAIGTKDILSYSFRAIHESSNLLRAMVNKLKLKIANDSPIVPFEVFHAVGDLSFEQLSNLRHRGAFSTVSLTFARCCQLTQEYTFPERLGELLLQEWYNGALTCIYEQSSTTRRSAGIPALITGILSANATSPAFEEVIARLKTLARHPAESTAKDETNLPQVHAMNCLKEIFKSSSLGKRCENHIADCLQIAAESLKSETWAIRNCGLLLLRSLIDCLFGTSESKSAMEAGWGGKSTRLAYERYPELPEILLGLIAANDIRFAPSKSPLIGAVESVFPALDIIRRAGPPKKLRQEIYAGIKFHLGSAIWHVRDIAARTICTLLIDEAWLESLTELLATCANLSNEIHGVLLATKYLLERRLELDLLTSSEGLSILKPILERLWIDKLSTRLDPIIEATYIEVNVIINRISLVTSSLSISPNDNSEMFTRAIKILHHGGNHNQFPEMEDRMDGTPVFPERSDTLLVRAITIGAIYNCAKIAQIGRLEDLILSVVQFDADIACEVLDRVSVIWDIKASQAEDLARLVDIYTRAYAGTASWKVRNIALQNLSEILEHLLQSGLLKRSKITPNSFSNFGLSISMKGNPDLSNAQVRIAGSLLALKFLDHIEQDSIEDISDQIQAWSNLLQDCGSSENEFDIRYAAVGGLKAFYSACKTDMITASKTWSLLPSLFALYDFLNDDDDEIREAAASVVSQILGSKEAPLVASGRLLDWLYRTFGRTESFQTAVAYRIISFNGQGSAESASPEAQFAAALRNDDSLFAEEEQNLYIDEVRESIAWTSLLTNSEMPLYDTQMKMVSSFALKGITTLTRLAEVRDDSFGWVSKPKVFAICMKIILAAKAVVANYSQGLKIEGLDNKMQDERIAINLLPDALQCLLEVGRRTSLHPVLLDELVAKPEVALRRHNI